MEELEEKDLTFLLLTEERRCRNLSLSCRAKHSLPFSTVMESERPVSPECTQLSNLLLWVLTTFIRLFIYLFIYYFYPFAGTVVMLAIVSHSLGQQTLLSEIRILQPFLFLFYRNKHGHEALINHTTLTTYKAENSSSWGQCTRRGVRVLDVETYTIWVTKPQKWDTCLRLCMNYIPALKAMRRLWFWDKQYSKTHKQDHMALILDNLKQWNFIHLFMANVFRSKTKLRLDEGYLPKEILKSKVMAQNHESASIISLPYFTNCMFNCSPRSNDFASVLDIIVHAIKLKLWPDYSRGG